jgi:superfamily I DNA/RNA helicase
VLSEYRHLVSQQRQSPVLEEALLQSACALWIYGGLRFFERQRSRTAIAYQRLWQSRR